MATPVRERERKRERCEKMVKKAKFILLHHVVSAFNLLCINEELRN